MSVRAFAGKMRVIVRRGLRPGSPTAFSAAILCVTAATVLRMLIALIEPNTAAFATFYPAVLVAALLGGAAAGIFAMLLSTTVAWWVFIPPHFAWSPFTDQNIARIGLFMAAAGLIIWVAALCRSLV